MYILSDHRFLRSTLFNKIHWNQVFFCMLVIKKFLFHGNSTNLYIDMIFLLNISCCCFPLENQWEVFIVKIYQSGSVFGSRLAFTWTWSNDICVNLSLSQLPMQYRWVLFEFVELCRGCRAAKPELIHKGKQLSVSQVFEVTTITANYYRVFKHTDSKSWDRNFKKNGAIADSHSLWVPSSLWHEQWHVELLLLFVRQKKTV